MEMAVAVALDAMVIIVAGVPAGCQLGGGSSGGCVGRSSRGGSHRNHQQDFSDSLISPHGNSCLCFKEQW